MERMEQWKQMLYTQVKVILDDSPSIYPKLKLGILQGVSDTHLFLKTDKKTEAIRLLDIRRVEGVKSDDSTQ